MGNENFAVDPTWNHPGYWFARRVVGAGRGENGRRRRDWSSGGGGADPIGRRGKRAGGHDRCRGRFTPGRRKKILQETKYGGYKSLLPGESVLRIRDVCPSSRIRIFSIPDSGSELFLFRIPTEVF
jgi:hypothetical protein